VVIGRDEREITREETEVPEKFSALGARYGWESQRKKMRVREIGD